VFGQIWIRKQLPVDAFIWAETDTKSNRNHLWVGVVRGGHDLLRQAKKWGLDKPPLSCPASRRFVHESVK